MSVFGRGLGSVGILSGYISRAGTQWFLLWLFAQGGGAIAAGEFSLALATTAPVFAFLELGMRNLYLTLRARPGFRSFWTIRLWLSAIAVGVAFLSGTAFGVDPQLLLLVVVIKALDSVVDICIAYYQGLDRISNVSGIMIANSAVTAVCAYVIFRVSGSPLMALAASAVVSLGLLLLCSGRVFASTAGRDRESMEEGATKRIVGAGIPLAVAQSGASVLAYIPVLYLGVAGSRSDIGVFSAAFYVITFANMFYNSIQQVWLAPLARAVRKDGWHRAALVPCSIIVGIGASGGLAATLLLPWLMPRIYGNDFDLDILVAAPLGVAVFLLSISYALNMVLNALNRYRTQMAVTLIALVGTGCATLVLGGLDALYAASILTALSALMRACGAALTLTRGRS